MGGRACHPLASFLQICRKSPESNSMSAEMYCTFSQEQLLGLVSFFGHLKVTQDHQTSCGSQFSDTGSNIFSNEKKIVLVFASYLQKKCTFHHVNISVNIFKGFCFAIYSHGGHLGYVTWTIYINFHSPFQPMLHMKFGFDWPSSFREEDL